MHLVILILLLALPATVSFAESQPSEAFSIKTPHDSYFAGEKVYVYVETNPNVGLSIDVVDSSKNIFKQLSVTSDDEGEIRTSFTLPFDAKIGNWTITTSYGPDFTKFSVVERLTIYEQVSESELPEVLKMPFYQSDTVLVGNILEIEKLAQGSLRYTIKVDYYIKNEHAFELMTATLDEQDEPSHDSAVITEILRLNGPFFDENDLVFVYLDKINGEYKILPQSFVIEKRGRSGAPGISPTSPYDKFHSHGEDIVFSGIVKKAELYQAAKKDKSFEIMLTIYDEGGKVIFSGPLGIDANGNYEYKFQTKKITIGKYEYELRFRGGISGSLRDGQIIIGPSLEEQAPLKQFKSGVLWQDIQCDKGLGLILRSPGGFPACVTPETKQKLIDRELATEPMVEEDSIIDTRYPIPTIIFPQNATGHAPLSLHPLPHTTIVWLGTNSTISLINESVNRIELIIDKDNSTRQEISARSHTTVQFAKTGFYEYVIRATDSFPKSGDVVVLGENLNSLDLDERLKMAEAMVNKHLWGLSIIGFAKVSHDGLLEVTIHETEAEKIPNAKDHYLRLADEIIPFDVPISVETDDIVIMPSM